MKISRTNVDLKEKFLRRQVVKVITGLSNFNINDVMKKVKAAEIAGATYVDIAANPSLVSLVKSFSHIPICVSSINPRDLYRCVVAGADIVEIGNFDVFYSKNTIFSAKQIITLAGETKALLKDTHICVTVPHHLLLEQQIELVKNLKTLNISCIQTEGYSTKYNIKNRKKSLISQVIQKSSAALSSTYAIAHSVDMPVIASSGISALSSNTAISYGASGVGIGSILNEMENVYEMGQYIKEIVVSISSYNNHISSKTYLKKIQLENMSLCARVCFN